MVELVLSRLMNAITLTSDSQSTATTQQSSLNPPVLSMESHNPRS